MNSQLQDLYELFVHARDEHHLFSLIASHAQQLGFEYCCYGNRVPLPVSDPVVSIFDSYPADWMNHYRSQGYLRIDPTVRAGMQHADLVVWPDTPDTHDTDHMSGLWSDAHDSGLNVGIAQGSWSAHGAFGLLTLARPASSLTPSEIDWLRQPVYWLANLSHTTMTALLSPKRMPEVTVTLTEREREVLCWSGEGKTAYEVGIILNITERTVNFHIRNVLEKLSATNKIQALVKAIAMGLVYPV